jgi:hypothetical protein
MAQELVWARIGDRCAAVSRGAAVAKGYEVLGESPRDSNGDVRRPTRGNGRPVKRKVSIPKVSDAKKAAEKDAATQAAEVIAEPASNTNNEE